MKILTENTEKKEKFTFNCTKCGKCCSERGPIPLVFDDLALWARNKVVMNFMPYLKFIATPNHTLDFVLSRQDANPFGEGEEDQKDQKPQDLSCPLYNKEKKECTVYQFRPLSCRTYPLEFDGKSYAVVDPDCEGIGKGEMTPEARKEVRELALRMNQQLVQMRISLPIMSQPMQMFVFRQMMEEQKRAFEKMSPEEREKIMEEAKRQQAEKK